MDHSTYLLIEKNETLGSAMLKFERTSWFREVPMERGPEDDPQDREVYDYLDAEPGDEGAKFITTNAYLTVAMDRDQAAMFGVGEHFRWGADLLAVREDSAA
jgi:hypothetical protein